jgi:UTP--glucose-1-phosphate uridylyltransferase
MNQKKLKYCVIPAGGMGSRWKPITDYIPKVMIPLVDRPTINWIIKEAIDSECTDIIFVLDKDKDLLKTHLISIHKLYTNVNFKYIYKTKIRGIAEVIYLTKNIIGNHIFSLIVSDHPCFYKTAPLQKMIRLYNSFEEDIACIVAFATYPKYNNQYYGECLLKKYRDVFKILHLCPRPNNPSINHHSGNKLRIAGRYIFNPSIFPIIKKCLETYKKDDLSDWDVFKLADKENMIYLGMEIKSFFLDMGTPETYGQASQFLLKRGVKPYET